MRKKQIYLTPVLFLYTVLLGSGCNSDTTSHYAHDKPKNVDLVGTWIPDPESVQELRRFNSGANAMLILKSDDKFQLKNLPASVLSSTARNTLISDAGYWDLDNASGDADSDWWEISFDSFHRGNYAVNICSNDPPYTIEFIIGNPDEGHTIYFQRLHGSNNKK